MPDPWRDPAAETTDYPGLYVHDGRKTGSITAGRSRLPLWAFAGVVATHGWREAEAWEPSQYAWTAERHDEFIGNLLEQRGEFARLVCILADVERRDDYKGMLRPPWWETKTQRKRVAAQLRRCLAVLEGSGA